MKSHRSMVARRRIGVTLALLVALSLVQVLTSVAAVPGVNQIATGGFGNRDNAYAWSMAWFKGKLYVGTAASPLCVENALLDYYYPGLGLYQANPAPDLSCAPEVYDLDLRAEIWRYTPETGLWEMVFESPTLENPRATDKQIAYDIGYRGMVVTTDPQGNETLLIGGVTAADYIPELLAIAPPRILKTTDGETFTALTGAPGQIETSYGTYDVIGYRGLEIVQDRLFALASQSYTGDGAVLEVIDPFSGSPSYVQVSPDGVSVFEFETFNGALYLGTGSVSNGYGVMKAALSSPGSAFNFDSVIPTGAGRGQEITSVVTMHVFRDRLYVGASGWYSTLFPGSELIRIAEDDTWQLVVGNVRILPNGQWMFPISGLPDGYGNIFNAHFWRMADLQGALYLGTNDWSWSFRNVPLFNWLLAPQFGFDVFGSCDGQYWSLVTRDAFSDGLYNFGARTMLSTPAGGFIGSANHSQGTDVWEANPTPYCDSPFPWWEAQSRDANGMALNPDGSLPAPSRLLTELGEDGTVLSWDAVPGAASYRILRAAYQETPGFKFVPRTAKEREFVPTLPPPIVVTNNASQASRTLGEFTEIGTTSDLYFVDASASQEGEYVYQVVAQGASGATSDPSNAASSEAAAPEVTFGTMRASIATAAGRGDLVSGGQEAMERTLRRAEWAVGKGFCSVAAKTFDVLDDQIYEARANGGLVADEVTREDLGDLAMRLSRHVQYGKDTCR